MLGRLLTLVVLVGLLVAAFVYLRERSDPGSTGGLGERIREDLSGVPQRLGDAKITGSVKAALELNRNLAPYPIDVDTQAGVVTLRGRVPSAETRELAVRMAQGVNDVREVASELAIDAAVAGPDEGGRSLGERMDDQALEAKVRLAFSVQRALEGTDLEVRAFRRELTLTGSVARPEQREFARGIAEQVPGVAAVRDQIGVGAATSPADRAAAAGGSAADVQRALRANPNLASYELRVVEEGGRLVLRGTVRSGAEKDLAAALAREAAGRPVENAVEIRP
jgi:osmotically-inducible protein OsmY